MIDKCFLNKCNDQTYEKNLDSNNVFYFSKDIVISRTPLITIHNNENFIDFDAFYPYRCKGCEDNILEEDSDSDSDC